MITKEVIAIMTCKKVLKIINPFFLLQRIVMEEKTLSEWRFGHSDQGQCFVAFAKDGSALVTGGADGELRVHQGEDYGDGESATVGDRVLALCCAGERAFTSAPMTNRVVAYDLSGEEPEQDRGFGLRTAADPTTLDVSSDGTMLAAGAEVRDSEMGQTEKVCSFPTLYEYVRYVHYSYDTSILSGYDRSSGGFRGGKRGVL
jgi:WD40 repeat protein